MTTQLTLLDELESRQDHVLAELDRLNASIECLLDEQKPPESVASPA